jgi:hypothetical protein
MNRPTREDFWLSMIALACILIILFAAKYGAPGG